MNSVNLQSEGFERASYSLQHALDSFSTSGFELAVQQFAHSVDRLARIAGMQAENAACAVLGETPVYGESDFNNV